MNVQAEGVKLGPMIHLLGAPNFGAPHARPRGNKVWGLLAFLSLGDAPPSRRLLCHLLFPDTDDPLGALRWNLSQLRGMIGDGVTIGGDPVVLRLPAGVSLDVDVLLHGTWTEAVELPGLGLELLEGLSFGTAPAFDLWLTTERARLGAASEAMLREAAVANLAIQDHGRALVFASRLVSMNPYDENGHVLVCRAMVASGDSEGAERHVDRTTELFEEELGVAPSPSFRSAALSYRAAPVADPSIPAVAAQLEAGQAAIAAGTWLAGIEALRGATTAAAALGDEMLAARAHLALGSALVHAARGFDEEGATSLHQAGELATHVPELAVAAQAKRELAYIELLRGRYDRAFAWLDEAGPLAVANESEAAWIAAVRGISETDVAHYAAARLSLEDSLELAEACGDTAAAAFAHAFLGRLHLLLTNLQSAESHLESSISFARSAGWTSLVPLPMTLLAEVVLLTGDVDSAATMFGHAFALARELGDPCWESLGARGLGLVSLARGDVDRGVAQLDEAPRLCRRFPDSYLWVEAYALETRSRVAVELGLPEARLVLGELESMAARTGMMELLTRAMLHRATLGDADALEVARSLAESIDNPALRRLAAIDS
ncbi:MAG: SARP family transcriptional regulator [Acidimicrobiia bacterium]|nr:SARP family transcriptional regulator [Acidimicrobiia bacterium]